MNNDNENPSAVVSLREQIAMREALRSAEAAKPAAQPDPSREYEVKIVNVDEPFKTKGVVVLTPAFFAVGVPTDDEGFDFNFSAPITSVEYIRSVDA